MRELQPDNNIVFNRLGNRLLPVFTGKVLPVLFLTVIMVLYSRKLPYDDYGRFQTVWLYCNIISVIISFGLSAVILSSNFQYFISFIKENRRRLLLLYASGALITFVVFYFTAIHFSSPAKLLLFAFFFAQSLCTVTDTLLIKNDRLKIYLWINILYTLVFFLIHLYFFYFSFILERLIFCITCLSLLKAVGIFFVRTKATDASLVTIPANFIANWIFIGLNEIAGIIARWLDKLFLLYLLSPAQFAVFFNGSFEIPLFGILISAMENIMLTGISSNLSDKKAAEKIFSESFKILSLIAFPLFFLLLTMHAEAFAIIFDNRYNASIPVFLVSIFIIPVRITHYGVLLQCYGQSGKIAAGSLMDIGLSLLLMFILYPLMGTPGVALAIVVSTYLQAGYYLWQSAKLMQVKITGLVPASYLIKHLIGLGFLYGAFYYLKDNFSDWISLVAACLITASIIAFGLITYWKKDKSIHATL